MHPKIYYYFHYFEGQENTASMVLSIKKFIIYVCGHDEKLLAAVTSALPSKNVSVNNEYDSELFPLI
jgi:hypothetical protein